MSLSLVFSRSVVSDSLWPQGLQPTRLPCASPSPGVCSTSCPWSWWCHPMSGGVNSPFVLIFQSHNVTTFLCVSGFHCLIFYWAFLPVDSRACCLLLSLFVPFIRVSYQGDADFQNKTEKRAFCFPKVFLGYWCHISFKKVFFREFASKSTGVEGVFLWKFKMMIFQAN